MERTLWSLPHTTSTLLVCWETVGLRTQTETNTITMSRTQSPLTLFPTTPLSRIGRRMAMEGTVLLQTREKASVLMPRNVCPEEGHPWVLVHPPPVQVLLDLHLLGLHWDHFPHPSLPLDRRRGLSVVCVSFVLKWMNGWNEAVTFDSSLRLSNNEGRDLCGRTRDTFILWLLLLVCYQSACIQSFTHEFPFPFIFQLTWVAETFHQRSWYTFDLLGFLPQQETQKCVDFV